MSPSLDHLVTNSTSQPTPYCQVAKATTVARGPAQVWFLSCSNFEIFTSCPMSEILFFHCRNFYWDLKVQPTIRHRVPGILKFRNVGQTPLGSAAVFGLFLGAGILGMDWLPLKWQGRIDLHQHHQHRQAIESLKFCTSFLPLPAGNSEADLTMHCASCIATSTTCYNQQLPHKTSAILIYPKSL